MTERCVTAPEPCRDAPSRRQNRPPAPCQYVMTPPGFFATHVGADVDADGCHVVHPSSAGSFAERLGAAGFEPVGVDVSELLTGGSVKCCTLEVYS